VISSRCGSEVSQALDDLGASAGDPSGQVGILRTDPDLGNAQVGVDAHRREEGVDVGQGVDGGDDGLLDLGRVAADILAMAPENFELAADDFRAASKRLQASA